MEFMQNADCSDLMLRVFSNELILDKIATHLNAVDSLAFGKAFPAWPARLYWSQVNSLHVFAKCIGRLNGFEMRFQLATGFIGWPPVEADRDLSGPEALLALQQLLAAIPAANVGELSLKTGVWSVEQEPEAIRHTVPGVLSGMLDQVSPLRPRKLTVGGYFGLSDRLDNFAPARRATHLNFAVPDETDDYCNRFGRLVTTMDELESLSVCVGLVRVADFDGLRGKRVGSLAVDVCPCIEPGVMERLAVALAESPVKAIRFNNIDSKNNMRAVNEFLMAFERIESCRDLEEMTLLTAQTDNPHNMLPSGMRRLYRTFPKLSSLCCSSFAVSYAGFVVEVLNGPSTSAPSFVVRAQTGSFDEVYFRQAINVIDRHVTLTEMAATALAYEALCTKAGRVVHFFVTLPCAS